MYVCEASDTENSEGLIEKYNMQCYVNCYKV